MATDCNNDITAKLGSMHDNSASNAPEEHVSGSTVVNMDPT
jgi:hypothetical protein